MYTYDFRVGFSQSDVDHKMTMTAIIDAFQDCSCFQSDELGVGFEYLEPRNLVWVLNYWDVDIVRQPMYGEKITVGTFPYEFNGFMGCRNFFLRDADDYVVKANSIWVLMDWNNQRIVKASDDIVSKYTIEDRLDMDYKSRKVAVPKDVAGDEREMIVVGQQHLDSNGHVNNGQFIKIAMSQMIDKTEIVKLRAEYKAQAHLGDEIYPVVYTRDNSYTIALNDREGKPYTVVELIVR